MCADFINPCPSAKLTSPFGNRVNPLTGKNNSFHQGIDLAQKGNVPILASASGTVRYAQWMNSYGNVVIIRHRINNKNYDTTYAHLKSFNVKPGQKVEQGQPIGMMGNTGDSTGQHLHFEVNCPEWKSGQPYAKNPLDYISLSSSPSLNNATSKTQTIISYLNDNNIDSSFANRKVLATVCNITNYTGSMEQNATLLYLLKTKLFRIFTGTVRTEKEMKSVKAEIHNKYPKMVLNHTHHSDSTYQVFTGTFKGYAAAYIIAKVLKSNEFNYIATIKIDK